MDLNTSSTSMSQGVDILSDRVYYILVLLLRAGINPAMVPFALLFNIVNIIVFWKMGTKDGVTAMFFILSISDCASAVLAAVFYTGFLLYYFGPPTVVHTGFALYYLFAAMVNFTSYSSTFATVIISVVRCCSVAMPLRVKTTLTARRQLMVFLLLSLTSTGSLGYGMTAYKVKIALDPNTNTSQLFLTLAADFKPRINLTDQYRNIVFYSCLVTVTLCVVVLIVTINRSSKFRSTATKGSKQTHENMPKTVEAGDESSVPTSADSKSNSRERQVINTVLLVSTVFILCSVPGTLLTVLRLTVPGFRNTGFLYKTVDVVFMLTELSGIINITVNILIYLKTNSRYRKVFLDIFTFSASTK